MWDWIVKNSEWVFSGIGVTAIVAAGQYLRGRLRDAIAPSGSHQSTGTTGVNGPVVVHGGTVNINANSGNTTPTATPGASSNLKSSASTITARAVRDAYDKAPPFQRDGVGSNYIGIAIRWDATLRGVSQYDKKSDEVRLQLRTLEKDSVLFTGIVSLTRYPEIRVMHEDTKLQVVGTIEEVDGLGIYLNISELMF